MTRAVAAWRRAVPAGGVLRLRVSHPGRVRDRNAVTAGPHWDSVLREYLLDWDDVRIAPDPHCAALYFARSAVRHACAVCGWDPALAASAQGVPPPVV
jgi:hypothetical protein